MEECKYEIKKNKMEDLIDDDFDLIYRMNRIMKNLINLTMKNLMINLLMINLTMNLKVKIVF